MKRSLLFYCQHSVGIGHLTRSFALVRAFAPSYRVTFLNGGRLPPGIGVPEGVEIVDLPPLGMDDGHTLVSRGAERDVAAIRAERRALVLAALERAAPDVLLVELFPFGRKKFAFELLPLLKAARRRRSPPLVVTSLRDILVSARPDQQLHDDRAAWLCRRYFDAVLVHADPRLARLEDTFRPRRAPGVPVLYTGFVVPERDHVAGAVRAREILVSAGGGIVGGPLFRLALAAHELLPACRPRLRIVAGPFLPEDEWRALQTATVGRTDVVVERVVPDLAAEMRTAALSVSQCGYNTALDVVVSGVSALVVPYGDARENEQTHRARRLAGLGVLRALDPATLTPASLSAEMHAALSFRPDPAGLDLGGASRSVELLDACLAERATMHGRARA